MSQKPSEFEMTTAANPRCESILPLESIHQEFVRRGDAAAVLAGRTTRVDSQVRESYSAHLAAAFPKGPFCPGVSCSIPFTHADAEKSSLHGSRFVVGSSHVNS